MQPFNSCGSSIAASSLSLPAIPHSPPSLRELAQQRLCEFSSGIVSVGNVPYSLIRPVLARVSAKQLLAIESEAPELAAQDNDLWQQLVQRDFSDRLVMGPFREAYARLASEKDEALAAASARLKHTQKKLANARAKSAITTIQAPPKVPRNRQLMTTSAISWRSDSMRQLARQTQASARARTFGNTPRPAPVYEPMDIPSKRQRIEPIKASTAAQVPTQPPPQILPASATQPNSDKSSARRRRRQPDVFIRR